MSNMSPKLYLTDASPPARAVLLTAKAIGLELEKKQVNLEQKEHLKEEYLKLNPQHTVPTFVDDDGFVLTDSHAITGYLIAKYAKNDHLYTKNDAKKRAIIDQRLHFDSSVLFPRGLVIVKEIIYNNAKTVPDDKSEAVEEAYGFLEKALENAKYVAGDEVTIADFSIITTLTSWDLIVPVKGEKYPNITAYIKRVQALPYYEEDVKGLETLKKLLNSKLSS